MGWFFDFIFCFCHRPNKKDLRTKLMPRKVTIYTTPTCVFCHAAKEYFKQHNIEYEEKDVTKNQKWIHEAVEKSGQLGVPVIDIDGQIVVGFNKPRLEELLGT